MPDVQPLSASPANEDDIAVTISRERPPGGHIFLAVCVTAFVALTAYGLWNFRLPLRSAWYARELRESPEQILDWLQSPDIAYRQAAEKVLAEGHGRQQIFSSYLREYDATTPPMGIAKFLPRRRSQGVRSGWCTLGLVGHSVRDDGGLGSSLGFQPSDPDRRALILGQLDLLVGEIWRDDAFPGFEFQLVAVGDGPVPAPEWPPNVALPEPSPIRLRTIRQAPMPAEKGAEHVLFFRVVH